MTLSYLEHEDNGAFISEAGASLEHSIASATCLLSGLQVFGPEFQDHERKLRVVHGLHAFHIYATEYWLDHLLVAGASEGGFNQSPMLCLLLSRLSSELEHLDSELGATTRDSPLLESQIQCLSSRKGLYEAARVTLIDKSTRNLRGNTDSKGKSSSIRYEAGADKRTRKLFQSTQICWGLG